MKKTIFHLLFACLFVSFLYANDQIEANCLTCNTPTLLSASNTTGTSAKLNWPVVLGATSYLIEVENGSGNAVSFFYTISVTTNSKTVTGLTPNKIYKFKVRAYCGSQKSNWSATLNFSSSSVVGGSCGIPSNLQASNITATTANLTWAAIPGATSYVVNVENGSGNPTVLNVTYTVTSPAKLVTGLLSGRAYKFKVRANCSGNLGTWSSVRLFSTLSQGMSERQHFQSESLIFPNPNAGNFTLQIPTSVDYTAAGKWMIVNQNGMIVAQKEWEVSSSPTHEITTENFSNGFYYFLFESDGDRFSERFLIQR